VKSSPPRWVIATGLILATLCVAAAVTLRAYSPLTREWVVQSLEKRYGRHVELGSFHATLFPPSAVAENVVFRDREQAGVPLATITKLTIQARFWGLLESPKQISRVTLEGLHIQIPPRTEAAKPREPSAVRVGAKVDAPSFVVAEIVADGALLEILPRDPRKEAKQFQIKTLKMHSVGKDRPLTFTTILSNFKPPGEIHSNGEFGPWNLDSPGDTPIHGNYIFHDADLSVFKGISGILSSEGEYRGTLERIAVQGATRTPDFRITSSAYPVDLKTEFQASVDGTNGDTFLDSVRAHFLHSTVLARGGVYGRAGVKGRTISLDINVAGSRIEDLLRLAVRSAAPPLVGQVRCRAKLTIPPGDREVIAKMLLAGDFSVDGGRFTNADFQRKLTRLSQISRGDLDGSPGERVNSNLSGRFDLRNAQISFSSLTFGVPGAQIALAGSYGIRTEELDFRGKAELDAKPSQMVRGFKGVLLKALDPFVRRNGFTVVPIRIGGTRSDPVFDLFHVKTFGGRK
jgi:hypothetical protein